MAFYGLRSILKHLILFWNQWSSFKCRQDLAVLESSLYMFGKIGIIPGSSRKASGVVYRRSDGAPRTAYGARRCHHCGRQGRRGGEDRGAACCWRECHHVARAARQRHGWGKGDCGGLVVITWMWGLYHSVYNYRNLSIYRNAPDSLVS